MRIIRAFCLAALLCVAGSGQALPAEATKLALMSIVGKEISVVVYQPAVGSRLDQNRRQVVAMPDASVDEAAVKALADTISRSVRDPSVATVIPALDPASRTLTFDTGRLVPSEELRAALRDSAATHLLVLTPLRAEARLKLARAVTGSGQLEGLGFYVDRALRTTRGDTGQSGTGFLAPFAYFRVSLVDLASWTVVKEASVHASTAISAARLKEGSDPWDVLTPEQKIEALNRLVRTEVERIVPGLLGAQ